MTHPSQCKTHRSQSGFVLVNALVLVAAMAAAALFVLGRSEQSRVQLGAGQKADQLLANLDAYESYAILLLAQDDSTVDHRGDNWARRRGPLTLERGQVIGAMTDLEALFNLNWLANPADETAQAAIERLLQQTSIRGGLATDLVKALRFDAGNAQGYATLDPPQAPRAGPRTLLRQMRDIPALSPEDLRALSPYVTLLPGGSGINVNTASAPVLGAILPQLSTTQIGQLITQRNQAPFATPDAFQLALQALLGEDEANKMDLTRIRVASAWFGVTINAELDGDVASRQLVLERTGPRERARVHWRITQMGVTAPLGESE